MGIFGGRKKDQPYDDQTQGAGLPADEFAATTPPAPVAASTTGLATDDVARKEQEIDAILHADDGSDGPSPLLTDDTPPATPSEPAGSDSDGESIPVNTLQAGDQVFPKADGPHSSIVSSRGMTLSPPSTMAASDTPAPETDEAAAAPAQDTATPAADTDTESDSSDAVPVVEVTPPTATSDTPAVADSSADNDKADQIIKDSEAKLAAVIDEMRQAVTALDTQVSDYDGQIKDAEAKLNDLRNQKKAAEAQQAKIKSRVEQLSSASHPDSV